MDIHINLHLLKIILGGIFLIVGGGFLGAYLVVRFLFAGFRPPGW